MIILGLDPGLGTTGWGLIRAEGNRLSHLSNGQLRTSSAEPLPKRLSHLATQLDALGPERVVFSSDWPHRELVPGNDPDWVGHVRGRHDLSADEIDAALDANPRRWFGLSRA